MDKTRARFLKQKATRFCILNEKLYSKDPGGFLLNCVEEQEAKRHIEEFHAGECGGHYYWNTTVNKIMRAGFYWPTFFSDTHKKVASCHKCHIFEGRRKLLPLPLNHFQVESPFQQWGIDFMG